MAQFKAIAVGDIPANRLVCLIRPSDGEENKIYIRLAKTEELADFVSSGAIVDGDEVQVNIKDNSVWEVEAGEDIPAGISLVTGENGTVITASDSSSKGFETTIGFSLHAAKAGEVVKYNRIYKVLNRWIDEVNQATGVHAQPEASTKTAPKKTTKKDITKKSD